MKYLALQSNQSENQNKIYTVLLEAGLMKEDQLEILKVMQEEGFTVKVDISIDVERPVKCANPSE